MNLATAGPGTAACPPPQAGHLAPGLPYAFTPHGLCYPPAPPWWDLSQVTAVRLGWWIAGFLIAGIVLGIAQGWITDRWELAPGRRLPVRRWYGTHAHVCLRAEAEAHDPGLYVVLQRDDEDASVPSLKVHKLNPEFCTWWDEDSEAFWAPVTVFSPYTVRRVRPHFERFGPVLIPWLTEYLPLRQPSGHLGEVPDAA